jgi:hypothetical protein
MAFTYGGQSRIYVIIRCGKYKLGGPSYSGCGGDLRIHPIRKLAY